MAIVDAIGVIPALFFSSLLAYFFSSSSQDDSSNLPGGSQNEWRWILGIQSIAPGIFTILRFLIPESPRYHLNLDRLEETKTILQKVARMNRTSLPSGKLVPLQGAAVESRNPLLRFKELFSTEVLRGTTPRIWIMAFCAQFASAGSVFALPKLLEDYFSLEQKAVSLYLLLGVIGVIPGLAVAWYVVEMSRKRALAAYYAVSSLGAIGFAVATLSSIRNVVFALVMSLVLRGGMEGMFSILNTIRIEVYPTVNRVTAMGVSQVFYNLGGIISPLIFGAMSQTNTLTWICMAIYALAYLSAVIPTITLSKHSDFTRKHVRDRIEC